MLFFCYFPCEINFCRESNGNVSSGPFLSPICSFRNRCRPGEEAAFIPLETTPLWQIKQQRGRWNPKSIDYELGAHFPDRFHALLPSHHN